MFPSKPTTSSKIPNDVTGGRLYTLKIFELNGKLYIKDNVIVKDNEDIEVQSYADSPAYEVFADGQSVPSSIADYVQEQNMFVDKSIEIRTPKTDNKKDTTNSVESDTDPQIDIAPLNQIEDSVLNPMIVDKNTQDGGMNQYVYNRVHRAYPKNVSFSKRNPQKKHNKKTIRKLQNIINNA
jgi:hypothetical protein